MPLEKHYDTCHFTYEILPRRLSIFYKFLYHETLYTFRPRRSIHSRRIRENIKILVSARSPIIFLLKITECNNYPGTSPVKSSPSPRKFPTSPLPPSPSNPPYVTLLSRGSFTGEKGMTSLSLRKKNARCLVTAKESSFSRHFEKAAAQSVLSRIACLYTFFFSHERSKFRDLIFSRFHPPFFFSLIVNRCSLSISAKRLNAWLSFSFRHGSCF